jgi:hypothetical protein
LDSALILLYERFLEIEEWRRWKFSVYMYMKTDNLMKFTKHWKRKVPVAHTYNPSYSGGRDQEDHSLKTDPPNSLRVPILKTFITTKDWWSGSSSKCTCLASVRPWVQTPVPHRKEEGGWKCNGGNEFTQGILYSCMELSKWNPLVSLMYDKSKVNLKTKFYYIKKVLLIQRMSKWKGFWYAKPFSGQTHLHKVPPTALLQQECQLLPFSPTPLFYMSLKLLQ